MKEKRLKNIIFFLVLTAKIVTIGLILFHFATDGLQKKETYSLITLILPLFTVYLSVMIKDLLSNPYKSKTLEEKTKRVKGSISTLTFIVFPIYFLAIIITINQAAKGNTDNVQQIIGILESAFGIYLGQIILTFFKKKEPK